MSQYIINPFFQFGQPAPVTRNAWVELGRSVLGVDGDEVEVTVPNKRYLMVLIRYIAIGEVRNSVAFNDVRGTFYTRRYTFNGGAEQTLLSTDSILDGSTPITNTQGFIVMWIDNNPNGEKLVQGYEVERNTLGSGFAPNRLEFTGKFTQTTPITKVEHINDGGTGDLGAGTEIIVLGFDPTDGLEATADFWQSLFTPVELAVQGDELNTGVFSAKKYMWLEAFVKNIGSITPRLRVGNTTVDVGNNYANRQSVNGGADGLSTSSNQINLSETGSYNYYIELFIVNFSTGEKLMIVWSIGQSALGPAVVPTRVQAVSKWVNLVSQIDTIRVYNDSSGDLAIGSILKGWGHN